MFPPLAARAKAPELAPETKFRDLYAESLIQRIPMNWESYCQDSSFVRGIALRATLMDRITSKFFQINPGALGIGLGCGMCTRSDRIQSQLPQNSPFDWIDVDLPEVIAFRQQYIPQTPTTKTISVSVTDPAWLNQTERDKKRPLLLIMEGVSPYLTNEEHQTLFTELGGRLTEREAPTEMIFDYIHPKMVDIEKTFKKVGDSETPFLSGFQNSTAISALHRSIQILSEYNYFPTISKNHSMFDQEFQTHNNGEKPSGLIHLRWSMDNRLC